MNSLYDMNHVDDVSQERDDDVLAALVHEGIDELLATDQSQQDLQHGQNLQHGYKRTMSTLRVLLALGLAFALSYILVTIRRMRFPIGRGAKLNVGELDEDTIRSRIIIDRASTSVPEGRQMFRREGTDGLKLDKTDSQCENTVQEIEIRTDSIGYVCTRFQLDKSKPGCCNSTDTSLPRIKQYTCDQCDTDPPHCCNIYEHCVSCCMHPLNLVTRREFLTHADPNHPIYSDPATITVFQYCQYRCRTSSASVQHQNSYRSHRLYCYGLHRPLKVLPTVNSDSLHADWRAASREGAREYPISTTQLEPDPYYQKDE